MKIEITRSGMGSKVIDDNGNDITTALGVRSITVECQVEKPTVAIMELIQICRMFAEPERVEYSIAGHNDVRGLVLADGRVEWLPGARERRTVFPGVADERRMADAHTAPEPSGKKVFNDHGQDFSGN